MIMGYIDPGSGSLMLQLLAGSIVGGLFILKTYWSKVKTLIRKLFASISLKSK